MVERIRRIYRMLFVLFLREVPTETPPTPKATKESQRDPDLYSFKAHILDYLDDQFEVLGRMKKHDREAYTLYKKVGAFIMADMWKFENAWDYEEYRHMRGWWKTHRPSFAAFYMGHHFGEDLCDDKVRPSFMYFSKYDRKHPPIGIQRPRGDDGDVYTVSFYYDDTVLGGMVARYAVHVTPEGDIQCLKSLLDEPVEIRAKRRSGHVRKGQTFRVPNRKWGYPPFFENYAAEQNKPVEDMLVASFVMAVNAYSRQHEEMTKIRVTKGGLAAVFSIPVLRTPYFFKDREYYKTPSGSRKPIFHIVRSHKRDLVSGGETYVRTHFRGQRAFQWNGYDIRITVPGWHHLDLAGMDAKAQDVADDDDQTGYLDMEEVGDWYTSVENSELSWDKK